MSDSNEPQLGESTPLRDPLTEQAITSGSKIFKIFGKITFQKLMLLSVYRLILYINKIYQDVNTTKEFYNEQDFYFLLISIIALITPPLVYSIYLIGAKLTKDEVLDRKDIGTDAVQGLLLFCWQIKRHLDLLYFSAQRICDFRKLNEEEENDLIVMRRNANVLEFFQNFYAGFIQILLQTYIFMGHWNNSSDVKPLMAQLITSILCVVSFMYVTKRKDDGWLTRSISYLGNFLLMSSRVMLFCLMIFYIHYWLILFCVMHVVCFSIWVFNIAIESYAVSSSSSSTTTNRFSSLRKRASLALLVLFFFGIPSLLYWPIMFQLKEANRPLKYLIIISLENMALLGAFFYFQTQASVNLQVYLIRILYGIAISTFCGVFLILFYVFCKPKYTDQVVIFEIREAGQQVPTFNKIGDQVKVASNSVQYGIYYDFCDIVFLLPSTHKIKSDLEVIRRHNA